MNWKALGIAVLKTIGMMIAVITTIALAVFVYWGSMKIVDYLFDIPDGISYFIVLLIFGFIVIFIGNIYSIYILEKHK